MCTLLGESGGLQCAACDCSALSAVLFWKITGGGGRTPHRLATHNSVQSTRLPGAGGKTSPMRDAYHTLYQEVPNVLDQVQSAYG